MKEFKGLARSFAAALAVVVAVGCAGIGGGDGGTNGGGGAANPFANRWVGSLTTDGHPSGTDDSGAVDWTIASNGNLSGSILLNGRGKAPGADFTITGSVTKAGRLTATISDPEGNAQVTGDFRGTSQGHLAALLTVTTGEGDTFTIRVVFAPRGASASNPFAGHWTGSYSTPNSTGTFDWTIAPSGNLSGIIHVNAEGSDPASDAPIGGAVDSTGGFTVTAFFSSESLAEVRSFPGSASINSAGHLVGEVHTVDRETGEPITVTFDLVRA